MLPEKYRIPRTKETKNAGMRFSGRDGIGQNGRVQLFYRRKQVWIYLHKSRWQFPTNRGQIMMLLKGNGSEGKSRIGVVMQKLLMTLLLVAQFDIYDLSCLARMRPEDVTADLAALKRKGYLQDK